MYVEVARKSTAAGDTSVNPFPASILHAIAVVPAAESEGRILRASPCPAGALQSRSDRVAVAALRVADAFFIGECQERQASTCNYSPCVAPR